MGGLPKSIGVACAAICFACAVPRNTLAQGPTPETGATLFPGGAYVSYGSYFTLREVKNPGVTAPGPTARPTLEHRGRFVFTWGFRRDFQLTALVPVVTARFSPPASPGNTLGGTGLGDVVVLLKHRFYRRDSPRGTTQASFSIGPKLPTGRTHLRNATGTRLPVGLQPGTGSTDLFVGLDWTYTGLFGIKRLVVEESLMYWARSEGAQQMKLGNNFESRFWLHYRPYQARAVGREWFIGGTITAQHNRQDRLAGATRQDSGGQMLLAGFATYLGLRPGMVAWFGADFPVVQTSTGAPTDLKRRIGFGITQQFLVKR